MGFFSSSSTETKRAEDVRTGAVAPDRRERARCWEARDAYFSCLDRNGIIDAVKDEKAAKQSCPAENDKFEQDCASAWVTYFKKWRVADIQKKARIAQLEAEGAVKVDVNTSFTDEASKSGSSSGVPKGTSKEDIQDMLARKKS